MLRYQNRACVVFFSAIMIQCRIFTMRETGVRNSDEYNFRDTTTVAGKVIDYRLDLISLPNKQQTTVSNAVFTIGSSFWVGVESHLRLLLLRGACFSDLSLQ